jgi:hypothetical protein
MLFWMLVGAGLAYFFHPQIDRGVKRLVGTIRDNNDRRRDSY